MQPAQNNAMEDLSGPKQDRKCRQSVLKATKILYYLNLLISFGGALALIILFPELHQKVTLTLILVAVYGFMLIWLSIFNIFFVIIKKEGCAVWCNRVIAKFIIMIFPAFYIIAYAHQRFLYLFWVKVFMIYLLVISILLVIYELYSCTWGHHEQPSFVYEQNDIAPFANQIMSIRRQFEQNVTRST